MKRAAPKMGCTKELGKRRATACEGSLCNALLKLELVMLGAFGFVRSEVGARQLDQGLNRNVAVLDCR